MSTTRFHIFETEFGWVGIGWIDAGICRLQLPERSREATMRRMQRTLPGAVEAEPVEGIADAVTLLKAYFRGGHPDLSALPLDLAGHDDFRRSIWAAARRLGHGETTTYGALAEAAGHKGLARETGEALGKNPVPVIVPCHRILAAGGKLGGFSAPGGGGTKKRLLALEGVAVEPPPPRQAAFAF